MDEASQAIELPLFPLNTVLFPGQVLPLHVFEPRYRMMIRHCLADDLPFGVVLIRQGQEVGDEQAEPHAIGTMARIIESTHLPDGAINIVTVGTERFRIRRVLRDQPYPRGEVENFPLGEIPENENTDRLARHVRDEVQRYIELIADAAGLQIQVGEVPEGARQIGYLAAVAMQIDNTEKQRLLGSASLNGILANEATLLHRENALLTWMAQSKEWPPKVEFGPGKTLLPN